MPTLSSNIVKREVASVHDVEEALARQALHGGDLATNLLEFAEVSEQRLTDVIAESLGLPAAPYGELPSAAERVRRLVPGEIAQRYSLYALEEADGRLLVAVSEPLPPEVVSDLEFSLGLPLVQKAATLVRVQQAIARDYDFELERRTARVLARLAGQPDPHPSVPVEAAAPDQQAETPRPPAAAPPQSLRERTEPARAEQSRDPAEAAPANPEAPSMAPEPAPSLAPAMPKPPLVPNLDLLSFARAERAERAAKQHPRRLGPYTLAMAENDLLEAETRDEVIAAFFAFSAQYFEYSALFAVHGDLAEGRDAHGAGASRTRVLAIGVPLDLPSTLAQVVGSEPHRLARLAASGLDGALVKDLQRRPGPAVLLLPVRVRNRTVLVLYGDHGDADVTLGSIGDVLSFAPLTAAALERVIRRRKEKARGAPPRNQVPLRPEPQRQRRNDRGERANALASLVESSARSRPPPADPTAPSFGPATMSSPPLARPVISIGPVPGSMPAAARSLSSPEALRISNSLTPGPTSVRPLPSARPTPIPSSFAPGAPPHTPVRQERKAVLAEVQSDAPPKTNRSATDDGTDEQKPASLPVPRVVAQRRMETPIHMPAPPADGAIKPPGEELSPKPPEYSPPETMPAELEQTPLVDLTTVAREVERAAESPEVSISATHLEDGDESWTDSELDAPPLPGSLSPRSRSIAHSARPLAAAGSSKELRLPAVIVDLAQDTESLVERLAAFDPAAAERLVQIGAAAVPALVGAFPGPLTAELRRGVGDGPARASECGPLLKVLSRIGPKAAGVLSVRSNDKDPTIRAWATRLLGEMPCLDAARAVARRFVDEDAEVRRAALAAGRMLEAHANSGAVLAGALSEMLLDSNRRDRLQHMVIEAIADLREARAVPTLATLLAAGSPEIQRSAHWALVVLARTDYGDNAAAWDEWWRVNASRHRIEWLIDALMHESQEIRRAAGDELKSLTKEYFGYYDDLPARERERAQKRYRDWWESKGKARFT
jgi:hypothetical protein